MAYREDFIFTSESVGEGHPDKVCDQISDAVLDEALKGDPDSRVACETFTTTGLVVIGGEITSKSVIDYQKLARETLEKIGYNNPAFGIDCNSCSVLHSIHRQSPDISQGVTEGEGLHKEQGAGDQGMMFGYACRDTPQLMPAPIYYAHQIMLHAAEARKKNILTFLRPDGKCQVTVRYEKGKPVQVPTVVLSHQHSEDVNYETLKEALIEEVIKKAIPAAMLNGTTVYHINPTGRFVVGGPHGDTGLTGRKIIVDTYGGMASHGGGAFSGKDPSKVDRSAAYMARYVAKNVVASGVADKCEVQIAYAIGVAEPVSLYICTYGTGKYSEEKIEQAVRRVFDLKPKGIITTLDLKKPIYQATASYGHFGREQFSWEKANKTKELLAALA
ncbi:MAG: methionine adenosyltransferase [Chitinispirillaceae bacterium]|nr:methionine adenosyltransferase [Chitinispirillaceae bacterium]